MSSSLYTTDILRMAVRSASYPRLSQPDVSAEGRAPLCGSEIAVDLMLDGEGKVAQVGMTLSACAFGQAAAAIFAAHAIGQTVQEIDAAAAALRGWLADDGAPSPAWPDIALLAPARATPARHGAIVLPFLVAARGLRDALPQQAAAEKMPL